MTGGLTSLIGLMLSLNQPTIYVGTYTSAEGSHGIYRLTFDTATGRFGKPGLVAETSNPSFLIHGHSDQLFAVNELEKGAITSFQIEPGGSLKQLGSQPSHGDSPCHLSLSPDAKSVYVANYGDGTLSRFPVSTHGKIAEADWIFHNVGAGAKKDRQSGPHGHAIYSSHRGTFQFSCDLGTDELLIFPKGSDKSKPRRIKLPPGTGPRHAVIGRDDMTIYVCGELSNTVVVVRIDQNWNASLLSVTSTIPTEYKGTSYTAEIACDPTGEWLLVSNRGHDSLAIFQVHGDGTISLSEIHVIQAKCPRSFTFDPSGRWILAAGQNSNDLLSYPFDPSLGHIYEKADRVEIQSPVSLVFHSE